MNKTTTSRTVPSRINVPGMVAGTLLAISTFGASPQAVELQKQLRDVRMEIESTAWSMSKRRRERFRQLTGQWRNATQWLSSTTDIAMHPAYQAIIGMGPEALPMILEELRSNSGHWYWALKSISNEDPVPPRDRGAIKKMRAAWLRWGEQRGLMIE